MTYLQAIFFGLVQGLTEFIPVSSSAHIVILANILGLETPGLTFEIFLHLASLLAVLIYFWKDLLGLTMGSLRAIFGWNRCAVEDQASFRFVLYLLGATLITGVLGILLENVMGDHIKATPIVAAGLLLTAVLLVLVERAQALGQRKAEDLTWVDAVIVGLAQTVAVFPGVSRSGITLIAGLYLKMSRETAVRFSFILAIPVLLGSSVLALKDISGGDLSSIGGGALGLSFLVSFIASIISIAWLIRFLKQQRLYWFSFYIAALAIYTMAFL